MSYAFIAGQLDVISQLISVVEENISQLDLRVSVDLIDDNGCVVGKIDYDENGQYGFISDV